MKKFSVLGLFLSLFVVFALSSCKKEEPKKDGLSFVGKTYTVLTDWGAKNIIEDESKMKDDDTRMYFSFVFHSATELTYKQGTYTPANKTDKTGEFNGNSTAKYTYTYNKDTRIVELTKVLSVTTDIESESSDPLQKQKEFAEDFKGKIKLQFDENFEVLTVFAADEGETRTLPLKVQK
ncbi:MAG: hypothetical protein CSB03_00295 [Bacteroidia bacterium]|nr:MAG: hypothetical protein CSB03_00295 [Bacteroidia bacterium]